jgi:hypothetical protein
VLDTAPELEREPGVARWLWNGEGRQQHRPVLLGTFELRGATLVFSTNSRERAEEAVALAAERFEDLATFRESISTDLDAAMAAAGHDRGFAPEIRRRSDARVEGAVEQVLAQHYARWTDEPVPMLDGATPRSAARSPELRPRVIDMLKDLQHSHERARRAGDPSFDPAPLWDELGLRAERDAALG